MAYSFDDYDALLASFAERDLQHNPSLSTTLSAEDSDVQFNNFYNQEYQPQQLAQQPPANFILSPEYTSASSDASPHDLQKVDSSFPEFEFNPNFGVNEGVNLVKQESFSDISSSASPVAIPRQTHGKSMRLSEAVPHGASISKRGPKKEKSSHNMIEKRYRTNINDKIKALRDSVPALRVLVESGEDDDDDNLDGLQPAKKLNKATILSKATEYIKHLETKNESLRKENDQLRARIYGGQITPGSSVSSYSSTSDVQRGMSLGNKVLLGGLACMVGSGLSDDMNDTRGLFSLPVFSYDAAGLEVMSKPLLLLLKVAFIFAAIVNFVFPSLFYTKGKAQKQHVERFGSKLYDDVRDLKTASIWSTFSLRRGHTNNDYVKSAMYRCILLKLRYANSHSVVKCVVDLYVSHAWSYLKCIQFDTSTWEAKNIRNILSLDNSQTINNDEYMSKFAKYDVTLLKGEDDKVTDEDYSVVAILYRMINDSRTNMFLRKFMTDTVSTDKSITEIEHTLIPETDEYNVELTTLFKPEEAQIEKFKHVLESWETSAIKQDDILVLYSSIIQNLVFDKKDFAAAKKWFFKIDTAELTKFNLLGFTSLYIIVLTMISDPRIYADDRDVIFKIEEISAILRIWVGNANGSVLNFKKRSQLIDFFVNVSLKINGMDGVRGDLSTEVAVSA